MRIHRYTHWDGTQQVLFPTTEDLLKHLSDNLLEEEGVRRALRDLMRRGLTVMLIDRAAAPGEGASFANGGQLSYSYVAPLASPSVIPKIPPWLLRRDSPLRFRPELDLDQVHHLRRNSGG